MNFLTAQIKNRNFYIMVFGDMVLFAISLLASYLLRFDLRLPEHEFHQFTMLVPFVIPIKSVGFFFFWPLSWNVALFKHI